MVNGSHHVTDVNPTPPLASVSNIAAQTQAERKEHFLQSTAISAQHHSEPHLCGANSCRRCRLCASFPLATHFGKKVISGGAVLAQNVLAPIAIVPDGGSGNQHLWRPRSLGQGLG